MRIPSVRSSGRTIAIALLVIACSEIPTTPEPAPKADGSDQILGRLPLGLGRYFDEWTPTAPTLVGAGDIARCYPADDPTAIRPAQSTPAAATARLLDRIPGTVVALGDNAYEAGTFLDYLLCYHPTWGRHRERTQPAVGNHEYITPGAAGYFAYFGPRSRPPLGYYSYDLGGWHVVVLNSMTQWAECPPPAMSAEDGRRCVGDIVQREWLRADLAAHPALCTVAYFHHPRFSSGRHGNQYEMQQFWDILYEFGVDVVLSAHDHIYERFAPQDPDGNLDLEQGIREFVVGTGGAELYEFHAIQPNSEVRDSSTWGVLALSLEPQGYRWSFVPVPGGSFTDAGTDQCH